MAPTTLLRLYYYVTPHYYDFITTTLLLRNTHDHTYQLDLCMRVQEQLLYYKNNFYYHACQLCLWICISPTTLLPHYYKFTTTLLLIYTPANWIYFTHLPVGSLDLHALLPHYYHITTTLHTCQLDLWICMLSLPSLESTFKEYDITHIP